MVWSKPFSHEIYRVSPKVTNIGINSANAYALDINFEKASELPRTFWWNINNQRKYFEWLSRKLSIKNPSDWYQVTVSRIESTGGEHFQS